MSILSKIQNLFAEKDKGYAYSTSIYGLVFKSPEHHACRLGKANSLAQTQYALLQMLCEQGNAEHAGGFLIPSDDACALQEAERQLLGLPSPWPGTFELNVKGVTHKTNGFSLSLRLIGENGRRIGGYELDGPMLKIGDKEYLPSTEQFLALSAVKTHSELSPEHKTEGANLAAVYAVQQAEKAGAKIQLRHFNKIEVDEAEHLRISIREKADGSLILIPDLGIDGISPQDIEDRLSQMDNADAVCFRIKDRIVLLDEKKLDGIREILSNREIPAKERGNFLRAPGTFLNAYLVDLDNGFSIRVEGEEVFRPAYFGESDSSRSDWFGREDVSPVILLSDIAPMIKNEEELAELSRAVEEAADQGRHSIPFKDATVMLPVTEGECRAALEKAALDFHKNQVAPKGANNSVSDEEKDQKIEREKTTIGIHLNDDEAFLPERPTPSEDAFFWRGDLPCDKMNFSLFRYQEEGIRWLVGHAYQAAHSIKYGFDGALLADDMGLGKTFMALAGINAWQNILRQEKGHFCTVKPVLIVAPVVLIDNWEEEIRKVFPVPPFSDVIKLHANGALKDFRTDIQRDGMEHFALKTGPKYGPDRLDMERRIVITNYDTLRSYPFSLASIDWGMVVFDEAQAIKNPNALVSRAAKALKADFRLAVTGTPVENSLIDFWNIFDTVNPTVLGPCQDFRKTYISPIGEDERKREETGRTLRSKVGHFMLRRNKEDELGSALPKKFIHSQGFLGDVNLCPMMSGTQLEAYDKVIENVSAARAAGTIRKVLLPSLRKLSDISLHPALAAPDNFEIPVGSDQIESFISRSAKLSAVVQVLHSIQKKDEKVILFVINRRMQFVLSSILRQRFKVMDIPVINGETKAVAANACETRKGIIKRFEDRPGFGIIIMSPLAAGVGLTVVGVNHVIHLERHWNPAKEAQASDRVYRIGQKKDVHIYIPILEHPRLLSFDKNLDALLSRKTDLKESVVTPQEIKPDDFNLEGLVGKA